MKKNTSSIFVLAIAAVFFVFASCNKLSKATVSGVTLPVTPDSIVLKSRVIVIDSTKLVLISTADQISQGTYVYTSGSGFPSFSAGDIIIGITGQGYLRNVTGVVNQTNEVELSTTQARLEDVFQQANINFRTDVSNLMRTTDNGYTYTFNNTALYNDGNASATITSGSISINPNWNFNMQFQNGSMTGFSAICQNGTLTANVQMNVTSASPDNINAVNTLNPVSGRTIIWFGQLPIVMTTNLAFVASVSGNVTGSVNRTLSYTNNDTYVLGDVYSGGNWQNQYNFAHTSTFNASASAAAGVNVACNIVPQMTVMIYGVACPSSAIALNSFENGNVATSSSDWDYSAGLTLQQSFNVSAAVLGYSVPDNTNSWSSDTVVYKTPYKIIKVSGDGQIGTAYQYLAQPIVVQVVDNNGNAQANVPVYFSVTSGGGSLSTYTVMTNSGGYAQTNWQIGNPSTAAQNVQAVVRMANGVQISGSPISFLAL